MGRPVVSQIPSRVASADVSDEIAAAVRGLLSQQGRRSCARALQTLLAVNPHVRREAAIQRYVDGEITLGRAAEVAGMTRWRFRELLTQRGIPQQIEARPTKELDAAVAGIRKRRR